MVSFKLIEKNEDNLVYHYYPEADENLKRGVIIVDRIKEEIFVSELAENDWERYISTEELNEVYDSFNRILKEEGKEEQINYATEPVHSVFYADPVIREISKRINSGEIPEEGSVVWY